MQKNYKNVFLLLLIVSSMVFDVVFFNNLSSNNPFNEEKYPGSLVNRISAFMGNEEAQYKLECYKRKKEWKERVERKESDRLFSAISEITGDWGLIISARFGDKESQYKLGKNYYDEGNDEKAAKWWTKAAEQGYVNAEYILGWFYYKQQNYSEAFSWLKLAVDHGDTRGMQMLGMLYLNGEGGVEQNYEEAAQLLENASYDLDGETLYAIAQSFYKKREQEEGDKWALKAAEKGYAPAQYQLGIYYGYDFNRVYAEGECIDIYKSAEWLKKSAEQGYIPAKYDLATYYDNGYGVYQDPTRALNLFKEIAETNLNEYTFNDEILLSIHGELIDEQLRFENAVITSQTVIANYYARQNGNFDDEAVKWYKKAYYAASEMRAINKLPYLAGRISEMYSFWGHENPIYNSDSGSVWYQKYLKANEEATPIGKYDCGDFYNR